MSDIDDLLAKAQRAKPERAANYGKWAKLWPVYCALRDNGFSAQDAVQWLITEGQVEPGEETKAIGAFNMLKLRKRKREQGISDSN
jgi:hypothetical protein